MVEKTSEIRKQVETAMAFSKDPLGFLQKDAEQHECFSRFNIGHVRYIHIFEPELIKHIFQTNYQNYTKDPENHDFKFIMGNGLLMNDSADWQKNRKIIQPLIQRKHSAYYSEQIVSRTNEMLGKWKNEDVIDVYSEMDELSFSIMSHAILGCDLKKTSDKVKRSINELTDRLFYSTQTVFKNTSNADKEKLVGNKKILDELLFKIIAERRSKPQPATDLLSMLLEATYDDGSQMSDEQIRDEIITLIFAGADTTASALTFLFYGLAQQVEIKKALRDELKNKKSTLCIQVIHEILRLYPPGWLIARVAAGDDIAGELLIKKGDTVLVSPYVMHRSKRFWNEPEQFIPERFESFHKVVKHSFIPFSTGPKTCVGNNFAVTTMQTVLGLVLEKFDLALANDQELEFETGLTLRPKNKILMKAISI